MGKMPIKVNVIKRADDKDMLNKSKKRRGPLIFSLITV